MWSFLIFVGALAAVTVVVLVLIPMRPDPAKGIRPAMTRRITGIAVVFGGWLLVLAVMNLLVPRTDIGGVSVEVPSGWTIGNDVHPDGLSGAVLISPDGQIEVTSQGDISNGLNAAPRGGCRSASPISGLPIPAHGQAADLGCGAYSAMVDTGDPSPVFIVVQPHVDGRASDFESSVRKNFSDLSAIVGSAEDPAIFHLFG